MKLVYQFIEIFIFIHIKSYSSTTSQNCDTNSRLVVDEDDNGNFKPERVKWLLTLSVRGPILDVGIWRI